MAWLCLLREDVGTTKRTKDTKDDYAIIFGFLRELRVLGGEYIRAKNVLTRVNDCKCRRGTARRTRRWSDSNTPGPSRADTKCFRPAASARRSFVLPDHAP